MSPFKAAYDKFVEEARKEGLIDLHTLTPGPYLENRLMRAFSAGWLAREAALPKRVKSSQTSATPPQSDST